MDNSELTPSNILAELNAKVRRRPDQDVPYSEPENELEKLLSSCLAEALQLDVVGRADNFFALGGDSLDILQILVQIRSIFGVELEFGDFFVNPTVVGLVEKIRVAQCRSSEGA